MALRVTVLGSGTAVPRADRFPAGHLVSAGATHVLVDLGPGVLRRLAATSVGIEDLDAVLLTHFHTDHCADVAALLFALRNPCYAGRPPLVLAAAEGLGEWLAHLTAAWRWLEPQGYDLELRELQPGELRIGELAVTAVPVEHTAQSLGYRLEHGGAVAAFTGDAIECDGVVELARAADLLVCDSAFPSASPGEGHMTPAQAGRVARRAGAGTLCLTHFYPECEGHDLLAEARGTFDGAVVLAADLLCFEVDPGRVSVVPGE